MNAHDEHFAEFYRGLGQRLRDAGCATPRSIKGFSQKEITELLDRLPGPVPSAYLGFLRVMGRSAGRLSRRFKGTTVFVKSVDDVIKNQTEARALLSAERGEEQILTLGRMEHDQFLFGYPAESEDPAVYRFLAGTQPGPPIAVAVTAYFQNAVDRFIAGKALSH